VIVANIKSAKKRIRTSLKQRLRNKMTKSKVKSAVRSFLEAVKAGEVVTAQEKYVQAQKLIDTTATKGILHKNNAARKKSRLASLLNKIKASSK
jgi:small subunit ribosomal protein S20